MPVHSASEITIPARPFWRKFEFFALIRRLLRIVATIMRNSRNFAESENEREKCADFMQGPAYKYKRGVESLTNDQKLTKMIFFLLSSGPTTLLNFSRCSGILWMLICLSFNCAPTPYSKECLIFLAVRFTSLINLDLGKMCTIQNLFSPWFSAISPL